MVWKAIKELPVTKKERQIASLYGIYIIVGLSILAWLIRTIS